jgi:hypothetical protein
MFATFMRDLGDAHLRSSVGAGAPITEAELAALPATAAGYLRFAGVLGRPRDWSFRLRSLGRVRERRDLPWMICEAWQYQNADEMARVFHMSLRAGRMLPVLVRETYLEGHARTVGRVLDRFTVAEGEGAPLDRGGLASFLLDALVLAPSMLLVPAVRFRALDDTSFTVELTDRDQTVSAHATIDARGGLTQISTQDRYALPIDDPTAPLLHGTFSLAVLGWVPFEGRRVPTTVRGVWHWPEGELGCSELRYLTTDLEFDVAPGPSPAPAAYPAADQFQQSPR